MAVDEHLAFRLRAALRDRAGVTEVRMFGCLCFMADGHMLCGVGSPGFMFRVGKERAPQALLRPGAIPFVFNGRRMGGLVWVDPASCDARRLRGWLALASEFVAAIPPKKTKAHRLN
jgi:hypothetical protein